MCQERCVESVEILMQGPGKKSIWLPSEGFVLSCSEVCLVLDCWEYELGDERRAGLLEH